MSFSEEDQEYMALAMSEANLAFDAGNYPVGAVLTIDEKFIGKARNSVFTEEQSTAHAEMNLLREHSALLRRSIRETPDATITVYTTLEPCLMCLGSIAMHRVSRIVSACPDPHGGAIFLDVEKIGRFYGKNWPIMETGLMRDESADLMIDFFKEKKVILWETALELFMKMKKGWAK